MRPRNEIPSWVSDYIGVPFREKGRDRSGLAPGVDCWGGVRLVYMERRGIVLPSHDTEYTSVRDTAGAANIFLDEVQRGKRWRQVDEPEVLDIARFFMGKHSGWHVGLVVARGQFLHWREGVNGAVERLNSPLWEGRLQGFFRFAGPVLVNARTVPLNGEPVSCSLPAGGTIAEMLQAAGIEAHPWLNVSLAGVLVPPPAWIRVRPKPGAIITVAAVPRGGGGGDSNKGLRTIATIAIIAAAAAAPGLIAGWAGVAGGFSATGAALISSGVGLAGMLAVSALIPPAKRRGSSGLEGSGLGIAGTRNEVRENDPVPVVLGRYRFAPPFASQARTEVVGSDQYVRMLYLWGYGPLAISDLKIGDTAIDEYEGVEYEVLDGTPGQAGPTLFPGIVLEDNFSIELDHAGNPVTRTSPAGADELSVDITFPDGLARLQRDGDAVTTTARFDIEYSPTGANTWTTVNGSSPDFSRGLGFLFRTPEVTLGGTGEHTGDLAWGFSTTAARPSYLPAAAFSWELTGYFYTDGLLIGGGTLYDFGIDCSDAGELAIGGDVVCSWYGTHASAGGASPDLTQHTGTARLRRGWHSFRVRVECRSGAPRLAVGMRESGVGSFAILTAAQIAGTRMGQSMPQGTQHPTYRWFDTSLYSGSLVATGAQTGLVRRNVTWAVPRGQYDVRVRRVAPLGGGADDSVVDDAYWTALRSVRADSPVKKDGLAMVAMRIRASDQLNGVVDTFNAIVQTVCEDYDHTTAQWVVRATSNPASLYRYLLQHPGTRRPVSDDDVNLEELAAFHDACRLLGLEYNGVLTERVALFDICQEVLAAGRGSPAFRDGKYTVVWDRVQTVPRQLFTPRNTYGYTVRRVFPDPPHALRVRFTNAAAGFVPDERVVLDDGYALVDEDGVARDAFGDEAPALPIATKFEDLSLPGVTSGDEAFKHGRYYLAVARLRPEEHTFSCDFEHLAVTRGDMILLAHDVPRLGLAWGRVQATHSDGAGNIAIVDLDEEVTMDAGETYRLVVRLDDGTLVARQVVTEEGITRRLTFQSPFTPTEARPAPGDLAAFGRIGHETRELVIKSIAMNGLHAQITCVDHATAVHLADQGAIPPWDPDISLPPIYQQGPETPVIEQIRSDDYVMVRSADGTLLPRMVIYLRPPSSTRPLATEAQVRVRPVTLIGEDEVGGILGPWQARPRVPIDSNSVSVMDVVEGVTYQIRLRTITPIGMVSPWVEALHTVVGKQNPPPDLLSFTVSRLSDGTRRFTWDIGDAPPDIAGVVIRYGNPAYLWDDLTPLHEGVLEASPSELNVPPAGEWRFAAKAIDTSGNVSRNALYQTTTLGPPRLEGVAFSKDEQIDGWPGTKTDCFVNDTRHLEAIDNATWDTLGTYGVSQWGNWNRWNLAPRTPIRYESAVLDAGFLYHFSPDAIVETEGNATVEVAWSSDLTTWSGWVPVADVRETAVYARAMKVRVTVYNTPTQVVPFIRGCLVLMRAPEVIDFIDNLDTSAVLPASRILGTGDIRVPVQAGRFQQIRTVSLTFNGSGGGYSWELVDRDTTTGPRIRIYNADDLPSHATIDVTIRGIA